MTPFTKKVLTLIHKIPKGKVATYSQIARLAGNPNGTRGVVWILHAQSSTKELPWHRVINAKGKISFPLMSPQQLRQKALLEKEKVTFRPDGGIDLEKYQWGGVKVKNL